MGAARLLSGQERPWSVANPGNAAARAELLAAILAAAAPQLGGGGLLLDCGCGTGWLLAELATRGVEPARLHGVDLDADRVAAAGQRVPGARVALADARDLPYADGLFAVVFQVVSLSSVGGGGAVRAALAESRRVLAPDGVLIAYEPRIPNPFNRRTRRLRRGDLRAAGLTVAEARSLTLLPLLGRRLGRRTPTLHPHLSQLRPLRSHRLLVCRAPLADGRVPAGRTAVPSPPR